MAEDVFTLTKADFSSSQITLKSIDAAGITPVGGEVVKLADILSLARPGKAESISNLVLCTAGGDRLVGTPQRLDGQSIVWFAAGVGDVAVPIDQCTGILRNRTSDTALAADRPDDQARLATGDVVKGTVTDVTARGFVITPQTGDPVTVPVDSVSNLLFATPPGGRKLAAITGLIVRVTSGTVVTCSALTVGDGKAMLTVPGGRSAAVPLQQILAIEIAGGPVSWLSARVPLTSEYTPMLRGELPARFDLSVTGGSIRFGGMTYVHGIGVHSRSRLVFAVEPGDATFRTRYAIDGNLGYADVNVRVSVDDKVVHEAEDFRAGQLSPVVQADVAGAKTVTLEVDFGTGFDVQDRLNWIEPAMIRKAPATQP